MAANVTLRVDREVHQKVIRIRNKLQSKSKAVVSMNDALRHVLLNGKEEKN